MFPVQKHMSEHMILKNVRIMPDCHKGIGCCVGLTAKIEDKIFLKEASVPIVLPKTESCFAKSSARFVSPLNPVVAPHVTIRP